jgi:hypothetical protein
MPIKHTKLATRDDGLDDGRVQPSWWNEDHDIGDFLSAIIDLAVTPGTVPYIKADGTAGQFALSDFARALLVLADAPTFRSALGVAALDSPAFVNTPTAPTAPLNANTMQLANMAALQAMRADLVASSPATLDTLNELAAALGNDPSFATTITNALAARLRFDAAQTLTTGQKAQALANLGLALAAVATTGAYADLTGKPTLGTAAALNVGTGANNIPQLDSGGKMPAVDGSALTNITPSGLAFGQCVLKLVSGNLVLLPYQGNRITINGVSCTVPDAGVSLAPTGLTVSTLYYVYAVATAGAVTSIEASTTGHATSTTAGNKGVEIKSGDNTRSLVGMAYIDAGPAFADAIGKRYVRSWFNDNGRTLESAKTGSTTSSVNVSQGMIVGLLMWAGEAVTATASGINYNTVVTGSGYGMQIMYDAAVLLGDAIISAPASQSFFQMTFSGTASHAALPEGLHTFDLGATAGGAGGTIQYTARLSVVVRR